MSAPNEGVTHDGFPYHFLVISTYRRALATPGALAFSSAALVSRLPISMITIGLVVLVEETSGSYALAGQVSAAYVLCSAIFRPYAGRLMDQFGQVRVLATSLCISMVALAATMIAVDQGWPNPIPHLLAGVTGAALPISGAAVRARWKYAATDSNTLKTAFALEGALDELVFMVGPTLITVLATLLNPFVGLIAAMVGCIVGTLAFVSQRGTEPPASGRHPRGHKKQPLGWHVMGPLSIASFCLGIYFGSVEVGVVAFTEHAGHEAWAGPVLAIWSLASLAAGLATGVIHWRISSPKRLRFGFALLALLTLPLPWVTTIPWLAVVLFMSGFMISPNMIAAVTWIEETVPAARLTEGMTLLDTAVLAGVAPGAALGGWMIDHHGAQDSLWVAVVASWLAAGVAFASGALHKRSRRETRPLQVPRSQPSRG